MTHAMPEPDAKPDLMARLWDEAYFRDRIRQEDAASDIGTAPDYGLQLGQFLADPEGFKQRSKLQSLLMNQLKQVLSACNLGIGIEAALTCGSALLEQRLQAPTPEQALLLEQVLTVEDGARSSPLSQLLESLLTPQDWEEMATAAAEKVRQQVLKQQNFTKVA